MTTYKLCIGRKRDHAEKRMETYALQALKHMHGMHGMPSRANHEWLQALRAEAASLFELFLDFFPVIGRNDPSVFRWGSMNIAFHFRSR